MDRLKDQRSPRERILATAEGLFYQQGFLATGINQIIAEAQVAKATFYQHFPSKEALAIAYLHQTQALFYQHLQQAIEPITDPKERVFGLFAFLETTVRETHFCGCAFLNMAAEFTAPESEPRQFIARSQTQLRQYIQQLVRPVLDTQTSEQQVRMTSEAIFLLFEAAMMECRVYQDYWPIAVARQATQQLLNLSTDIASF